MTYSNICRLSKLFFIGVILAACADKEKSVSLHIKKMDSSIVSERAKTIESGVSVELAEGLKLRIWAIDSLIADPVSIDMDDLGRLFYTRTRRQNTSEFDIRSHPNWEIPSISLQSIEEKKAFLKKELSPENSSKNTWLTDLNKDGSHDWRDLIVEKEQIYRIEDVSGDGLADLSQLVIEDFHTEVTDAAGAIMVNGNELFFGVGPDMWRLTDSNNDGATDDKVSISTGYGVHIGYGGHGMSGLEMGPEGKVYWQIGDIGFNAKGADAAGYSHSNNGVIVRSNPDGSDFEIFAYGNRNTHEFVFDDYGNLISVDNDGDHPGENERLVYVVDGADMGWRINWQFGKYRDPENNTYKVWMNEKMYAPRFEGQAAYFLPGIVNYKDGPTGMLYNPGTALGPEWKNTFFIGEFVGNPSKSGIHAFKLKPKGASFEMTESKPFMKGILATGIDFGPDGAMYVADWIEGWDVKNYGRVWKIDVSTGESEIRTQTKQLLADNFKDYDAKSLAGLLKHEDKRIRQKSQFELVKRGDNGLAVFKNTIMQRENQLARVHAIWGISQFARQDIKHATLLMPLLNDSDDEICAQAARWIGDVRYGQAGTQLLKLLRHKNKRVRFFATEALGRIKHKEAVNPIIDMLRENNDEDVYLRHAGSLALARIGNSSALVVLASDPAQPVRLAAVVALRRMGDSGISKFLNDTNEFIVTEAARGINDDLNIQKALPALADLLITTQFTNEPLIRRIINANLEIGNENNIHNLLRYAQKDSAPPIMRTEALDALGTWVKPSVLDRVDGRYRGIILRDSIKVRAIASDALVALASNKNDEVRLHAIRAIKKLKISIAGAELHAHLKSDKNPKVRVEALNTLATINDRKLNDAIKVGLSDHDKYVRITALDLLQKSDMSKNEMVTLLSAVIQKRTTEEKQAAISTLSSLPLENNEKAFGFLLSQKEKGILSTDIDIELEEAIAKIGSANLKKRYNKLTVYEGSDSLVKFKGALVGGNVDRGRDIFYGNQTAQCLRCHSFDDQGGNAGPRLNGVGSRLKKEQILQALVSPSARIAPGFGTVSLKLNDGRSINGILQKETNEGMIVKQAQRQDSLILNKDILSKKVSGSSMPPMSLLLNKKEIRDLVSFLETLKE